MLLYIYTYKPPLRDVADLKSRLCRKLKRGSIEQGFFMPCVYEPPLVLYRCCSCCCCCCCCCCAAAVFHGCFMKFRGNAGWDQPARLCSGSHAHKTRTEKSPRRGRGEKMWTEKMSVWGLHGPAWPCVVGTRFRAREK